MKEMQTINGLRTGMVQMPSVLEPMEAAKAYLTHARQLAKKGADVIIGSEMMLTHYVTMGDDYEITDLIDEMWQAHLYIVEESKTIDAVLIYGGVGLDDDRTLKGEDGLRRRYNAVFVVQNGEQLRNDAGLPFAIKTLLPTYRIFDDPRYFFCLRKLAMERGVALSDLLKPFTVTIRGKEHKLGVMICEDGWHEDYAQNPAMILADNGAEILFDLSCSNWSWRKNQKRDQVIGDICRETGLWCVYVNNVGVQNNGKNFIVFDGGTTIYNGRGEIVYMMPLFTSCAEVVVLNHGMPTLVRTEEPDVKQMYTAVKYATAGFIATLPSHLRKVGVAVSGGKDSTATLCLMVDILGAENVKALTLPNDGFTSDETLGDVRILCKQLGVELIEVPIGDLVKQVTALFGIESGSDVYKTGQAGMRHLLLALWCAQNGMFYTSNANMLELAMGYGTLIADLRGTFAPWGNCLAQDVYRMLDYMNREIFDGMIPQSIIDRPPMDELTAVAEGDDEREDPFFIGHITYNGYHDQLVRAIIAFRHGKEWFVERYFDGTLEAEMQLPEGTINNHFPTAQIWLRDLNRCFRLYHNALFKGVQSPPCPLVDKRSKGWDLREPVKEEIETTRFKELARTIANDNVPPYQAARKAA